MKYDDASWHYGGEFPTDLPNEAGATHIGMFVAWAMLSEFAGQIHLEEWPEQIKALEERRISPGYFFLTVCDGKFTDEDLNAEGNRFAASYYFEEGQYLDDYVEYLAEEIPTAYHVEDTWQNFDLIKPVLDNRLASWRENAI